MIFSLAKGSPSLALRGGFPGASGADFFTVSNNNDGPEAPALFASHTDIGLLASDDAQMLEPVTLVVNALTTITNKLCGDIELRLVIADDEGVGQPVPSVDLQNPVSNAVPLYVQARIQGDLLATGIASFVGELNDDATGTIHPLPLTQSEASGIPGAPFPDPQNRIGMFPIYRDIFGLDNFHPGNGQPIGPGLFQFLPLSLPTNGNGQGLEGQWSNIYKCVWQSEDPTPRLVDLTIQSQLNLGAYTRANTSDLKNIESVRSFTLPLRINLCPCETGGDPAVVDVQDLLQFLSLWFVGDLGADFNNSGATDITDLLEFLSCWFPVTDSGVCL